MVVTKSSKVGKLFLLNRNDLEWIEPTYGMYRIDFNLLPVVSIQSRFDTSSFGTN